MICPGCSQEVYPIGDMIVVPHCEACNAVVNGVNPEAMEGRYPCGACGHVGYVKPVREVRNRCPIASCRATFPKQEAVAEVAPAKVANDAAPKQRAAFFPKVAKVGGNEPVDVETVTRDRLAFVQARIAELRPYEAEERKLLRVLAAIDELAAE